MGNTPHWFKCAKCKRGSDPAKSISGRTYYVSRPGRPVLTGREKVISRTSDGKIRQRAVEYRCEECEHVGWTRHPSMTRREVEP